MEIPSNNVSIETLLEQVQNEPNNWSARKRASLRLYEAGRYLEAADVLWKAPEMPATDVDVAFSIKVVSRARPNRSIRLVYELIRRNAGKPTKNLAMAYALNMVGMPMLASRFYGAAVAEDGHLFDLSFEKQTLWYDDSGSLLDQWKETDQEAKPPLEVPLQSFTGEYIEFDKLAAHGSEDQTPTSKIHSVPANPLRMPKPPTGSSQMPVNPATSPTPQKPVDPSLGKPAPFVAPPVKPPVPTVGGAPVIKPPLPKSSTTTSLLGPSMPSSQVKRPVLLRADLPEKQDS